LGRAVVFHRELGRQLSGGVGLGVSLHLEACCSILRWARPRPGGRDAVAAALAAKTIFCMAVTEERGGSDIGGVEARARRAGGRWALEGRKKYISLARTADEALVLARTGQAGYAGLTLFAVPRGRGGYRVIRTFEKLGTRSVETAELELRGAAVGDDRVVGALGGGFALVAAGLTLERLAACAQLLGALEACERSALGRLRSRGGPRPLWGHQALRHQWADIAARRGVLWRSLIMTAWSLEKGLAGDAEVAALKLVVAPEVERLVSQALQLHGGAGYTNEYPVERVLRDCRLARIGAGTDEIMREIVSASAGPAEGER
jgi:acyl-CoA dehydrogenase/citronellyl-CoA dehydrogenase